MALVDLRRHDEVDEAVLVLEQHEDDAVRRLRALARDGHPRHRQLAAVREPRQLDGGHGLRRQVGTEELERMDADREPRSAVVGEHLLPGGLLGQRRRLRRRLERQRELARAAARGLLARHEAELPEQHASRLVEAVAGAGLDERLEDVAVDRRPLDEIAEILVRPPGGDRLGVRLPHSLHVADADAHRAVLDRARRVARVDVRRQRGHAAALRIADEARRRVEAHRLGVEQRAEELHLVVAAQPRRLVREQRERGGMRLREAEAGERGELVVDAVRRLRVDAVPRRALDEPLAERLQRLQRALAAHRAAQPLRLADREAGERHRHLQHLVLEDDDAERLLERLLQQRMVVLDGDTRGRAAASRGGRCTGGRRRPGSVPGGRAPPGR